MTWKRVDATFYVRDQAHMDALYNALNDAVKEAMDKVHASERLGRGLWKSGKGFHGPHDALKEAPK
jgi:hypothetical protein